MIFENWANGQPNNYIHGNDHESSADSGNLDFSADDDIIDEDAVVISSDGFTTLWHDYPINDQFEFVCLQTEYIAAPGLSWKTF